jgi:hypothetical protein
MNCQRAKIQRHTRASIGTFRDPDARFTNVHIDIVGPLPYAKEKQYLLTMVDRFSRWSGAQIQVTPHVQVEEFPPRHRDMVQYF